MRYHSFPLTFRGLNGVRGYCWVDLYLGAAGHTVAVVTDGWPDGNPGPSVTNAAEVVWTLVEREHVARRDGPVTRIESWRHREGITWDLVQLTRLADGSLVAPRWQRLSRRDVEAIIGGVVEEPGP